MPAVLRLAALVLALPFTAGCLTTTMLVKVRPDGSGTVEQTILLNVKALEMAGQMMGKAMGAEPPSGQASPPKSFTEVFSEADFKKMAEQAGPGVRFVSSTPLTDGDKQGARVVFAFDDINKIQVDPTDVKPSAGEGASSRNTSFKLARLANGNALLTIDMPDTAKKAEDGREPGEAAPQTTQEDVPPEMAAMIKQMFAGMRIGLEVEVEGRVVRTNAPFASGSRITILEMDLDQLLQQEDALKKLPKLGPGTDMAQLMTQLKDIKGLKISPPPVEVEFR